MFIKKSSVDEITSSLEENLNLAYNHEEILAKASQKSLLNYLNVASEILDEIGLEKEAASITSILKKVAEATFGDVIQDSALPKSSEQALHNLEQKGWMFNDIDDAIDDSVEDHDEDEVQID